MMPRFVTTLSLIAAVAFGSSLYAQETEAPEAEANTETEETGEATAVEAEATTDAVEAEKPATDATEEAAGESAEDEEGIDMGREVANDPTYVKETYGDWELKCFRNEGQDDLCQMYQLLKEETGNPIAEFSLFKLPGNAQAVAGATIVVPLGTLLPKELQISVDSGKAKSFAYQFCSMAGCFARIGLTQSDLEAFKRGSEANLLIVPAQAPDQKVVIKASLNGFTAAFDNVSTMPN